METYALLKALSEAPGPAGYETSIRETTMALWQPLVDEVHVDAMGNLIGIKRGTPPDGAPRRAMMGAAHMDEIGLMVQHIDDDGFLKVVPVGGWYGQTLLAQRVLISTRDGGRIPGVVGSKPPHMMDAEDRKRVVKIKEMFIDCGAAGADEAAALGVEVGAPITIDRELLPLGNGLITGKALDNRAGCVMMISALKILKRKKVRATIQAVGTVQEEVGLKGARTSAYGLSPDVAIATDVTIPGDHPGLTKNDSRIAVGKGPSITIIDAAGRGVIARRPVVRWLRETADKAAIPYQLEVGNGGNTDATAINITKAGIPCTVVTVPARYIHSPVEVLSLADLENGAALIAAAIQSAHQYF